MLTTDSRDEQALQRLIRNPDMPEEVSASAREAARTIRDFFIRQRGWPEQRLARYRFRDLMAMSGGDEVVLAVREGARGWAARQDDMTLELALAQMQRLGTAESRKVLESMSFDRKVVALEERRIAMRPEEWQYVERLVRERVGQIDKKSRISGAQVGDGIRRLLEASYGR